MANDIARELGWNDPIENDSSFELLPEGDYNFKVTAFERGRFNGSEKMPACNMAILTIEVGNSQQSTTLKHNLMLHTKTEWKLCEFFTGIGQRKHGEKLSMNWNTVIGSTGKCKLGVRTWNKRDGTDAQSNEITKFYEPEEKPVAQTWTPGGF